MIILTTTQADQVRGLTVPGHALAPRSFASSTIFGGQFALPESCITDPAHSTFSAFLASLPRVADSLIHPGTLSVSSNPDSPLVNSDWMQSTLQAAFTYQSSWPVARRIQISTMGVIQIPSSDVQIG